MVGMGPVGMGPVGIARKLLRGLGEIFNCEPSKSAFVTFRDSFGSG